jgi:hypothetical protein
MKYAYDLVLWAKEEPVLQGVTHRLKEDWTLRNGRESGEKKKY